MTIFQLILFIVAGAIFYMFFRQLFSGNYPKRGVDFEANPTGQTPAPITDPGNILSRPAGEVDRVSQLMDIADKAAAEKDWIEVKKAMQSALILDKKNSEAMGRLASAYMYMNDFASARETLEGLLDLDEADDVAHDMLANALHKLGEDDLAIAHHQKAIELDDSFARHYYNYANTLVDLGEKEKALKLYQKALDLDPELNNAKEAIEELRND